MDQADRTTDPRSASSPDGQGLAEQATGALSDLKQAAAGAMMPLGDHLDELRRRLIYALLGLVPIVIASLAAGRWLLGLLVLPFQNELMESGRPPVLVQLGLLDTFTAYLKLSIVAAVLIGSPWVIYQLWKFVAPGLYGHERRFVYVLLPLSTVLTASSALFLYFAVLPIVILFFVGFSEGVGGLTTASAPLPEGVTLPSMLVLPGDPVDAAAGQYWFNEQLQQIRVAVPNGEIRGTSVMALTGIPSHISIRDYLGLLFTMGLGFAVAFQMPVVVLLLGWARLVTREFLGRYRRYAVLVCAALGAILTPADPLSMVLMGSALYVLFELGLFLLKVMPPGSLGAKERGGEAG